MSIVCVNKKKKKRHETPVLDHPIKIIFVDNDLVVLDKPCSLPVSSCKKKPLKNQLRMEIFLCLL